VRERDVERALVDRVTTSGGLCIKLTASGVRGWPDRMVLMPGGRIWFVELKAPGETARGQQVLRHLEITALGFPVVVLDTVNKVKGFVDAI
jgi:hypothetical protein